MSVRGILARSAAMARGGPRVPRGARLAPAPPAYPPGWHAMAFRDARLDRVLEWQRIHGEVVRTQFAWITAHVFFHPEHVRFILQEGARHFDKRTRGFRKLSLVMGNGLLISDGDFWLRQRRIAQPAFHRRRLASFGEVMVNAAREAAERMEGAAETGHPIDIAQEMMRVTLQIVTETLLGSGVRDTDEADRLGEAVGFVIADTNRRINDIFDLPLDLPTRRNRTYQRHLATLDEQVYRMIEAKRRGDLGDDLLSMFLEARDEETGEGMSDEQLRDEVMTIFLAGHETTANALSWTFKLLSENPDADRHAAAEIAEVLGDGDPRVDTLGDLPYLRRVLDESMRLYPPAWALGRAAKEDVEIAGYHIPAHSLVFVSPWATHRHPAIWEDPEGFDPDRFLPERAAKLPRFAYFPFGGGPRQCIGNGFAIMEAMLVLASLLRRYRFELVPGHRVRMDPQITLRPRGGLPMRVRRR